MKSGRAVNFCDYDSLKHYDSGSFNSKYKTDLIGSVQEVEKESLPDDILSIFLNKQYKTCKTLDDLILYRVFGLYSQANGEVKGAGSSGGYASTEFKLKKSDLPESDVKATVYKIPVCCSCGDSDVTKLKKSEQFEVEGSKGNRYIMRFHCNNKMWVLLALICYYRKA